MSLFRLHAALAAALFVPGLVRADPDVTVVVDMSAAGRKVPHPTADHPSYYLPTMGTFEQLGIPAASEKPPSVHALVRLVAEELAKQSYLVAIRRSPDLIIDISWGYISPSGNVGGGGTSGIGFSTDPSAPLVSADNEHLRSEMLKLVLGHTLTNVVPVESFGHQEFLEAANDNRYFVLVTAYDFAAWDKQHQRVPLWKAKMSVPKTGVYFDDVMASLVKAGGPSFGTETATHPKLVPAVPEGKVQVGTPTVVGH